MESARAPKHRLAGRMPVRRSPSSESRSKPTERPIRMVESSIPGMTMFVGGQLPSLLLRLPEEPPEEFKPFLEHIREMDDVEFPSVEEFAERAREIRREVYAAHYGAERRKR